MAAAVSHIGEMAKRVFARSSSSKFQWTIKSSLNQVRRNCKRGMLTPEAENDTKEHEMFAALFAHLEQTEGTKADSAQAAARRALRKGTRRTSRPGRASFAARAKRVAPHFTRGQAHPRC